MLLASFAGFWSFLAGNWSFFCEQYWTPDNQALDPFIYMTVGTGIGVGVIVNGLPLHGLIHTEAGHFAIPHNFQKDPFPGIMATAWKGWHLGHR